MGPLGTITSGGATTPTRAGAGRVSDSKTSRISPESLFVKTKTDVTTALFNELFNWAARVVFDELLHAFAHHGVLSHENLGPSTSIETSRTGLLELL